MSNVKSGMEVLKQQTGLAAPPKRTFAAMLEQMKPEFAKVLPRAMTAERLIRIAMTEVSKNPMLGTCTPESVIGSLMIGAQLGLEPGVMGQAYLIPYNTSYKDASGNWQKRQVCTFVPGWQGMVDLVSRSGRASVETKAVYEGEEFDVEYGTTPKIHHKPLWDMPEEECKLRAVYAIGRVANSETPIYDVWGVNKVRAHLDRYNKVGDKHYAKKDGGQNFEMYARKLPLLQVIKYLPKSVELATAAHLEYSAAAGTQALTIQGVANDAPIESPMLTTPYDEQFGFLGWDEANRADFLAMHKGKSEAEIKALLATEMDRE